MSSNFVSSIPDQATDRSTFTDRTPPLKLDFIHRVPLIGFTLPSIFNLLIIFTRCCTGLIMCSIHIDESAIHVSAATRPSRLCVPFSEKLDSLLICLDNRLMMHGFQCNGHKWAHGDRNDARYCSATMLHGYKYLLRLLLITISHSFAFSLRVFLSPSSLSHDGRQEGN
jgi:hypothetical protein